MKIRLQRYMADCGVAARRECEQMIADGRVQVNGEVVRALPAFVNPSKDIILVDQEELTPPTPEGDEKVYFLLNKPKGILVTNSDPSQRRTVTELMSGVNTRVFPVGRLDMDSRGALIMTNDGELANRLTHPRFGVEKTYIVEVEGRMSPEDVERVKRGMWLGPEPGGRSEGPRGAVRTDRFHVKILGRERGRTILEAKIAESKNREIRRVMARIGHPVRDLNRVAIGDRVTIRNLPVGSYRPLTRKEVEWLYEASSPERHERQRAQTQQWYEQKEMEKERRRLEHEAAADRDERKRVAPHPGDVGFKPRQRPVQSPAPAGATPFKRSERDRKERPVKKGKKPFVPPTGRNAGKMIGGNKLGRKNFQQEQRALTHREQHEEFDTGHEPSTPPTPRVQHPLGGAARDED